jgi:exonuclease SbcC
LDGRLSEIQSELEEEDDRKAHLAELQERLEELAGGRRERAKVLENVQRLHTALEEQRKMLAAMGTQLENAAKTRDRTRETLEARREEKAGYDAVLADAEAIEKAYQDWQEARGALEAMEELAEQFRKHEALRHAPLAEIQAAKARLIQEKQGLEEQKANLEKALAGKEALESRLKSAQAAIQEAEQKLSEKEGLEKEIRQLQADHAEARAENPRLRDEMNELKDRIEQLRAAEGVECPLCGQPLDSEERQALVDELTTRGKALGDKFRENKALLENFEVQLKKMGSRLADMNGVDAALREAVRQADQIENQLKTLEDQQKTWAEKGAHRLAEINAALAEGDFAVEAREKLEEIDAELEGLGYNLEAHEKLRQTEADGREAEEKLRALEGARAALKPIEREIAGLEEQLEVQEKEIADLTAAHDDAAATFAASEADLPELREAESSLHDIQEQENRLRLEVGAASQKVAVLATLKERKAGLVEEREGITRRIADLKQLERAFGKDGIPALLIEQALPEIEETTNELLSRLTDGRMSFSFLTQREYKDASREDLKETLDIVISDNLGERDYEMFSGGEAFRINFSIRLALSEVLARRAGARLQTLVIDEGFGSQDALGRQRLVEAINMVRDDFEKILVITHLEELKEAFPTRIEVEKTPKGSQLQVVM